ncbi:trypsin-like peptidase domain-containing protein [Candidatus Nephthysia bennettiae]|uniref:Trypsin-like peptidase domain-containing protein n=1 Tax=Candidatus Nephthysia bennettiae TaxID=3127016 RepID=A0A934KBR2_9BACT|nr:trypsin-like peptidase domain-containing protein [Candidatus Dormibacteraeota bacterium]MBJ7612903.1 trypsin-like peptidase domain-containing protein [Candidatus Dormibacteraeota bacterium]
MIRSVLARAAAALLALPLLAVAVACGQPFAQSSAPQMTPENLFVTSKPGTVMVLADFKAHLTVPDAKLDDARFEYLKSKAVEMVLSGQLPADSNAIAGWMIDQVLGDPIAYFTPTDQLRQADVELVAQGSGFVVSPDGYIVTNAHVAAPDEAELKQQLAANGLKSFIDQDVKDFISSSGGQASPELVQKVTQAVTTYDTRYLQVARLDKSFSVQVGAAIPGVKVGAKDITADVSAAGQQIPGKDVAVLKVERKDLPTVPLGDDSQVSTGDKVFVLGYPGAATFHPILSDESQIEPTMTSGTVSAKKTMPGGWSVIQIDAPITHGSSGGPVFDANGRVIGIATFGSVDPNTGKEIQGFNFAVPVSVAREYIGKAGAHPEQGIVTQKYDEAIALYDKHWYSDALAEFQQVNSLSPGHPYVQDYIGRSQLAVAQGKDRSNEKYIPLFAIGVPLALLAIGGVVVGVVVMRRRSRRLAAGAATGPSAGSSDTAWASIQAATPAPVSVPAPGQPNIGFQPAAPQAGASFPGPAAAVAVSEPVNGQAAATSTAVLPRFCSSCGNEVVGKAFCDRCGHPVHP